MEELNNNYMCCYITISTKNICNNIHEIEKIAPHKKILAMIKANTYGHGTGFVTTDPYKE